MCNELGNIAFIYQQIKKSVTMKQTILIFFLLLSSGLSYGQIYFQGGVGLAKQANFGGDMSVGYTLKNTTISTGYFAIFNPEQPVFFSLKAGQRLTDAIHLYGGVVRVQRSSVHKELNTHSWIAGIEYNTKSFQKGRFYYSANYIPSYFFVCMGMKFNY